MKGDAMLGLELREEFRGKRLKGTQIELPDAVNLAAADFLRITYPSGDVLSAVEPIGPEQGHPVVLIGEPGQGKSHLMAALVHALNDPTTTPSSSPSSPPLQMSPCRGASALLYCESGLDV